ncbi:cell envelope biogenesis protein OmpA [Rhodopila sp.]|uniref:cell envelope biogenesis protein OmpA n=1 Tax=Rhodopila sp. TaxID=2480087 RepID=UPI003D0DEDB8
MPRFVATGALLLGIAVAVVSCTDPYDPNQRAVGGGLLGAGAGAAVGGLAGGGSGALVGGLAGGALGAVGGAATTPQPPPPRYRQDYPPAYRSY